MSQPVAVLGTGLVTSAGLSAPAACAAIRAKVANPTETRFMDSSGEWILAHQVPLDPPLRNRQKLARMAALAIEEALALLPRAEWSGVALILCVAERDRPGRLAGLDEELFGEIQVELGMQFGPQHSLIVPHGRVGVAVALLHARQLLEQGSAQFVLVAATDSLLTWPTLSAFEGAGRLLTQGNSNGFLPGEGAGALLVGRPDYGPRLLCTGVGMASEPAHLDSGEPLRGNGLAGAIRVALQDAGRQMHELDFRITDISGEHYYFKEATLALSRLLRARKEEFDIWHPAECIGEAGSLAGIAAIVVADAACRKGYSPGHNILCHAANDGGQRMALVLQYAVQ